MAFIDDIKGLIGVKAGEVDPGPQSGLYITSLPDITLVELSKIADSDQTGGTKEWTKVWADIETRGILRFRTLFVSEINRCSKLNDITVVECIIKENKLIIATALWYLLGAELMNERINSTRINRYTTIDKAKAKELYNDFMDLCHSELSIIVNSIDLSKTTCIELPINNRPLISFNETVI